MNSNFESDKNHKQHFLRDSLAGNSAPNNQRQGAINTMMRDRFELLSAYLDGEVTAAERRQVEEWLAADPSVRGLYDRLISLRHGLQEMPVPVVQQPAQDLANLVFQQVDRRRNRTLVWAGGAIAAMFVAMMSGVVSDQKLFTPQLAGAPVPATADGLMLALNEPVVDIVNPNDLMLTVNEPVVEIPKPRSGTSTRQ
ncbi:zf-HC2 domain-containing protein [Kamptonema sp. UHCC 0994]|uniref:anti-sigma factor family protein n=1 Tax=Kamptonema sp. UHCC 0994 TaxID=3031329 RepID=UPI0023BB0F4A|nr:zf-HC2 domain-containing protein [Kamptonema sp. UHCC 0994]MDF0556862.1 zf-HC2 domain-containing protein [Kamptonema sp. UHCC 0994]